MTRLDKLERLATLKDRGLISQTEFEKEKAHVLESNDDAPPRHAPVIQEANREPTHYGPPPDSNIVWAILTTLLCFLPFGIVALVKASSVSGHWYAGHRTAAHDAAQSAKNWSIAAAVTGIVLGIIVVAIGR